MSRKRTPDKEPQEAAPTTAVAEPTAAEATAEVKSFAERVGKKQRTAIPDPFGIATDVDAGVHLFESKRDRQMAIKFDEKPSPSVLEVIHKANWKWNASNRIWAKPLTDDTAMSTRIDAERLFQQISRMIRVEKGIGPSPEVPF